MTEAIAAGPMITLTFSRARCRYRLGVASWFSPRDRFQSVAHSGRFRPLSAAAGSRAGHLAGRMSWEASKPKAGDGHRRNRRLLIRNDDDGIVVEWRSHTSCADDDCGATALNRIQGSCTDAWAISKPPADPEWAALARKIPPDWRPAPVCPPQDNSTFAAFRLSQACRQGFVVPIPESELRNQFDADGDRVGRVKSPDSVSRAIGQGQVFRRDYSNIRVPVLALLEFPVVRPDFKPPKDDSERATVNAFVTRGRVLMNRWIDKVRRHVPDVRVVDVPGGGHYVFLTRESDVLREIHTFVASLVR